MLRRVRQHLRLAAGRIGAAAADGAALRLGIGSALCTHYANRIGQSNILTVYLKTVQEVQTGIAGRFKARRLAMNLTQRELAARSGVTWSSLKRFEREGLIALDSLLNLALVLDCLDDFDKLAVRKASQSQLSNRSTPCWPRRRCGAGRRAEKDAAMAYSPTELLTVYLDARNQHRKVGRLAFKDRQVLFEYDASFIASGIEISPIKLPLRPGVAIADTTIFDGLFGVFNDSLPDGWGRLLLDRTVEKYGIHRGQLNPLDRLAYVGRHGMGALSYEPELGLKTPMMLRWRSTNSPRNQPPCWLEKTKRYSKSCCGSMAPLRVPGPRSWRK
jgi:transcriptional regulator with XRE-family HTH domain